MSFDYVRGGGSLSAPERPTQGCLSWRLRPDGTDVWQADDCAEYALPLCQSELQPFICNTGPNSTRPIDSNPNDAKAKVFCPPGTNMRFHAYTCQPHSGTYRGSRPPTPSFCPMPVTSNATILSHRHRSDGYYRKHLQRLTVRR